MLDENLKEIVENFILAEALWKEYEVNGVFDTAQLFDSICEVETRLDAIPEEKRNVMSIRAFSVAPVWRGLAMLDHFVKHQNKKWEDIKCCVFQTTETGFEKTLDSPLDEFLSPEVREYQTTELKGAKELAESRIKRLSFVRNVVSQLDGVVNSTVLSEFLKKVESQNQEPKEPEPHIFVKHLRYIMEFFRNTLENLEKVKRVPERLYVGFDWMTDIEKWNSDVADAIYAFDQRFNEIIMEMEKVNAAISDGINFPRLQELKLDV